MRVIAAVWVLFVAGQVASAQVTAPGGRVRVLGDTMARQVVTQVAPVYPATALARGVTGEVTLYAAVGKDGAVEDVALVDGPAGLSAAAMEAVKHWKYKPWLVNGAPVEVDTTVVLDFKPGGSIVAAGTGWAPGGGSAVRASANTGAAQGAGRPAAAVVAVAPAAKASAPAYVASAEPARSGGVDWEADRQAGLRAGALPIARSGGPNAPGGGAVSRGSGMQGEFARPTSGASMGSTEAVSHGVGSGRGVVAGNRGPTEWRLVKKVAPVYPAEAEDAGIEGVVQVAGVVKTDGTLRNLHAVSGPEALRQAAVDAAAQYVWQPVSRGDELDEAPAQVPVVFTLTGPAKVAPEVMAGMLLNPFTPPYPPEAVKAGVQGAVVLHVLIGRQGEVKDVKVVSGREMLRATAVDAVKQFQYTPYRRAGVDVEVETDVTVQFSIVDR